MPQMGVSVAEGTIVEWRKRVGDWVEADEPIVEISTDKVETEIPSPASGRVAEILVEPGTTVDVGAVLCRLDVEARPGVAHVDEGSEPEPERTAHGAQRTAAMDMRLRSLLSFVGWPMSMGLICRRLKGRVVVDG